MKRLLFLCLLFIAFCSRAAVPTFESFSSQFLTNNFRVFYDAVHTNDAGIIYPAQVNSLSISTNQNIFGTFSLPSKVELLTLGTNYLDVSTNSTWLLNSPTNDAAQVILSLSAGAHQGQLLFITSQNGGNSFTLPDLSEQWDVPGAFVDIQGDWLGTTNRGIILQYTAPDWIEMARFDPAQSGGGSVLGSGTANYFPYWLNASTLSSNSPLVRVSSTSIGINSLTNILTTLVSDLIYSNAALATVFKVFNGEGDALHIGLISDENPGLSTSGTVNGLFLDGGANYIAMIHDGSPIWFFGEQTGGDHFLAAVDNTYDIGLVSNNRPRDLHLGRNAKLGGHLTVGSVTKAQKTALAPADGMIVYQTDNTPGLRAYINGTWFILSTAADP